MTLDTAIRQAKRQARDEDQILFVVYEDGEYEPALGEDLDGFFFGAPVIATVFPNGEVEQ